MGRIDTETKAFMSDPSRFADAFNYLIYDGQPVIKPEDLKPLDTTEIAIPYGNNARVPEQKFRDVLKLVSIMQDEKAIYVVLGAENQAKVHYAMPVKDMLYDSLNYARQVAETKKSFKKPLHITDDEYLSGFRKGDKLMPVITLVIYFGASEWDGPMSIHEMLNTTDQTLLRFVPDYQINLIAPMKVPDEDFEKFNTDFRDVMQFVKCSKDEEKLDQLTEGNERFTQMNPETAELINLITDSKLKLTVKEGTVDMCQAIQQKMERSKAAGVLEGEVKGKEKGRIEAYAEMVTDGTIDIHFAAKKLNMTVDEFVKKTGIKPLMN